MKIKDVRNLRHITLKEMAQRLKINESNFVKYENYQNKPNILIGLKIAHILQVNPDEIFKDEYYEKGA